MSDLTPSQAQLERIFTMRHGPLADTGWAPQLRRRFGHFTPDEVYEAVVDSLVRQETVWLDVGCGRRLFPSNEQLAKELSQRCAHLTGVDPDATIDENPYLHSRARCTLDAFTPERQYDLATLRMVAEHVDDPEGLVKKLRECLRPGGRALIYTVNRWSPVPLITAVVPFAARHPIKKALWGTETKDTFPTRFKMNTRGTLRRLFATVGMREVGFAKLDDLRSFSRFKITSWGELTAWRALRAVGLHYPENCLLGMYE